MMYTAYQEAIEGAAWMMDEDIDKLKAQWCFSMRIFKTSDLTMDDLLKIEKPRYPKIKEKYELVHSLGHLMHEEND